jgi:hypothetical protein
MTLVLNDHQHLLINPLKERNDWMTANDLARALNKDRLTHKDLMELDHLADMGLCVKEIVDGAVDEGDDVRYRYSEPKVEPKKDRV